MIHRAKRIDNGEILAGYYIPFGPSEIPRISTGCGDYQIDPATLQLEICGHWLTEAQADALVCCGSCGLAKESHDYMGSYNCKSFPDYHDFDPTHTCPNWKPKATK